MFLVRNFSFSIKPLFLVQMLMFVHFETIIQLINLEQNWLFSTNINLKHFKL